MRKALFDLAEEIQANADDSQTLCIGQDLLALAEYGSLHDVQTLYVILRNFK